MNEILTEIKTAEEKAKKIIEDAKKKEQDNRSCREKDKGC